MMANVAVTFFTSIEYLETLTYTELKTWHDEAEKRTKQPR